MTVHLSKLHGTGNDFLVAVARDGAAGADEAFALAVCDRHRGIGADGLITLLPGTDGADCTMELRNADGGIAEMSGNGIRCLAWVAVREGLGLSGRLVVETDGGRRTMSLLVEGGELRSAAVDMGPVTFEPAAIPLDAPSAFDLEATFHGTTYRGDAAGMGNPHLVLLVDDVDAARVAQHGPHLEVDERFPNRTNVEFVAPNARGGIDMRVWERGVGETLSCGTGACAAAAVAHRRGIVGADTVVRVRGGELSVTLGETVLLGGPVAHVFDTEVDEQTLVGGGE
jgi:diaminopimelate epimerase